VAEVAALMELAKSVALQAGERLLQGLTPGDRSYVHSRELPREVKAIADDVLNKDILQALAVTELAVLSEESGYLPAARPSSHWFIVDPLDGTFNFIKSLGPSAVSIALWEDRKPIFGVIYDLADQQLAWGGAGIGAFVDGEPILVSQTPSLGEASLCTGFPVRFDVQSEAVMRSFCQLVSPFAKIRMIGSAAMALLQVARGSADVYLERDIMLWDVAAGVAIVEGAGGKVQVQGTQREWCHDVVAANTALFPRVPGVDS
jgi:myo-inositol-1(or 4)-monophosphatase